MTEERHFIRLLFHALRHSLWHQSRPPTDMLVIRIYARGMDVNLFKSEILHFICRCLGNEIVNALRSIRVNLTFATHPQHRYEIFIDFCYCYINRYHTVRDWSEDGDWITRHRFDPPLPFLEESEDEEWND